MQKTLVAFDADRIKGYVFGTDKLKEIRGASALLDKLNRETMRSEAGQAKETGIFPVYTNGGQGLFVVIAEDADTIAKDFGKRVKKSFTKATHGGASVTYVVQPLPENLPDDFDKLKKKDLADYFKLLQVQMEITKGSPANVVALPAHPLIQLCDACGVRYAEVKGGEKNEPEDLYYCQSCQEKQDEDARIKEELRKLLNAIQNTTVHEEENILNRPLWERISFYLRQANYDFFPFGKQFIPQRPEDFHAFRPIAEAKEYIGLIYADANNMGAKVAQLKKLGVYKEFAEGVDRAIHQAMSKAIKKHLPIVQVAVDERNTENTGSESSDEKTKTLFPFDIFLVGGDDIVMMTDASKAMEVALTIGQEFREIMKKTHQEIPAFREIKDDQYSLSIGVVMAPIKYPFRMMRGLVENVLKDAKTKSSQVRTANSKQPDFDDTCINFRIVNGGMQINANNPYVKKYKDKTAQKDEDKRQEFYATLRPYSPKGLDVLIKTIKDGQNLNLGRTKLHQMRESILHMNTTSSVSESIAVLRNWNEQQRKHITDYHRHFGALYQKATADPDHPLAGLPRLLFPWFLEEEGTSIYRTALLDLVELYDFVSREKGGRQ